MKQLYIICPGSQGHIYIYAILRKQENCLPNFIYIYIYMYNEQYQILEASNVIDKPVCYSVTKSIVSLFVQLLMLLMLIVIELIHFLHYFVLIILI